MHIKWLQKQLHYFNARISQHFILVYNIQWTLSLNVSGKKIITDIFTHL